MDKHITTIWKNASEEIRISLSAWEGHDLINVRVWMDPYEDGDGSHRAGGRTADRRLCSVKGSLSDGDVVGADVHGVEDIGPRMNPAAKVVRHMMAPHVGKKTEIGH
jgi:hypothetical protein